MNKMENYETLFQAAKIFDIIRQTCNADGYWAGDHNIWDDIVAVRNLEYLLMSGCGENDSWQLSNGGIKYECSIKKIFIYLNSRMQIKNNVCTFGEDFWDILELLIFIERNRLFEQFPLYNKFKKYASDYIKNGEFYLTNNKWTGVGTIVSAIRYYKLLKRPYAHLVSIIEKFKNADGTYGDENDVLTVIWHTSQVASILAAHDTRRAETFKALAKSIHNAKFLSDYNRNYYLAYLGIAYVQNGLCEFNSDKEYVFNMIIQVVNNGTLATDRCALCAISQFYIALLGTNMVLVKPIALKDILVPFYETQITNLTNENKVLKSNLEKFENSYPINKKLVKVLKWISSVILAAIMTAVVTILITKNL